MFLPADSPLGPRDGAWCPGCWDMACWTGGMGLLGSPVSTLAFPMEEQITPDWLQSQGVSSESWLHLIATLWPPVPNSSAKWER